MEKVKVLAIAPYEGLAIQLTSQAKKRQDLELHCFTGDLEEGLRIARREMDGSYDVVISRGGTATLLAQNGMPVIDIPISIYDLLRSIRQADGARKRYAIVGFEPVTRNAVFLKDVLQSGTGLEVFTISRAEELPSVMKTLMEEGVENVICDQVSAMAASRCHLNYILINSGSESIASALDNAVLIGREKARLRESQDFMLKLLEASPALIVVYNGQQIISRDRRMEELSEGFKAVMKAKVLSMEPGTSCSIEYDDDTLVHSAHVIKFHDGHTVFYIRKTKAPFRLENNGIVLRNTAWAHAQFMDSFYGCTNQGSKEVRLIEAYSKRDYPVFIYGERGTGKGNLAQLLYSISLFADSPLYDIDMQLAGENAVTFIRRLYEEDPDKKATFHFKNIDKADTAVIKQIIDLNEELALSARAHIIASATIGWQENLSASCIEYIERLQCLTLKTRSLREHRADIPSLVNLYISTLNRRNGTETISMEDDGMKLLEAFDWNGNNDQLARVLKRLNAQCTNSLISASEVRNELMKEEELVKATSEAGLGNLIGTRTLKEIENSIVHMVLAEEDGNRTRTAKRLGLSRATLWRMLQEEEDNK